MRFLLLLSGCSPLSIHPPASPGSVVSKHPPAAEGRLLTSRVEKGGEQAGVGSQGKKLEAWRTPHLRAARCLARLRQGGESPGSGFSQNPSSHAPLNPKEKPIWASLHRTFPEREGGGLRRTAFFTEPARGPARARRAGRRLPALVCSSLALLMGGRARMPDQTHIWWRLARRTKETDQHRMIHGKGRVV